MRAKLDGKRGLIWKRSGETRTEAGRWEGRKGGEGRENKLRSNTEKGTTTLYSGCCKVRLPGNLGTNQAAMGSYPRNIDLWSRPKRKPVGTVSVTVAKSVGGPSTPEAALCESVAQLLRQGPRSMRCFVGFGVDPPAKLMLRGPNFTRPPPKFYQANRGSNGPRTKWGYAGSLAGFP